MQDAVLVCLGGSSYRWHHPGGWTTSRTDGMGTAPEDPNRLERSYRCVPERGIQGQMSDIRSAPATMSLPQRVRSHGCCVLGWVHGYREPTIMHRVRFHLPGSVMGVSFPVGIGNRMGSSDSCWERDRRTGADRQCHGAEGCHTCMRRTVWTEEPSSLVHHASVWHT